MYLHESVRNPSSSKALETMTALDIEEPGSAGTMQELTNAQAKRITLRIDLVVMPSIVLAMTLAFLDMVCISLQDPTRSHAQFSDRGRKL